MSAALLYGEKTESPVKRRVPCNDAGAEDSLLCGPFRSEDAVSTDVNRRRGHDARRIGSADRLMRPVSP